MTMTMGVGGPMTISPKQWFTAAELADLKLPGLSAAKRKINELAQAQRWALRTDRAGLPLARPRQGRGGGTEYHVAVLPPQATTAMVKRGVIDPLNVSDGAANDEAVTAAEPARTQLWSWFDQQAETVKAEARRRLGVIDTVDALESAGLTRSAAVETAADQADAASSTVWAWLALITGATRSDRLPLLAPQRKGGGQTAELDDDAWRYLLSDYLRPERPTFASCYRRCLREFCGPRGLDLPHQKTLLRRLEKEVPAAVITLKRHGAEALRETSPAQQRSVAGLHALEAVNVDGHRWDVFVNWPGRDKPIRPMMVAIQDIYSRKILAWRIAENEDVIVTRLAFADLFRVWGIPNRCLLDNGRAFASKMITGGAKTRFRFSIKEDDPLGLLPQMGVKVQWATPYSGRSKPIERPFRDLCDNTAKHPAFAGAYTGNKPDAKPENYGSRAVDLETFKRIVGQGIEAHNAQVGRDTEICQKRLSFDQAFLASYETATIGKATAAQLRLTLLASKVVSTDRKTGAVAALGSQWWSPEMSALAGRKVTLRYDPDNLAADVHVHGLDGRYLASAQLQGRAGFFDEASARDRARQVSDLRKATRKAADLLHLHTARELAEMMPDLPDDTGEGHSPSVIRPVRPRGVTALKPTDQLAEQASTSEAWMAAVERLPLRLVD